MSGRIWIVVLCIILAPAALVSSNATAALPCAAVITLTPGERVATITAVASDAVQFRGNLTITEPGGGPGTVSLIASVSTGWVAVVSPSSIKFDAGSSNNASFNATVIVPAATAATEIGQLTVTARPSLAIEGCKNGQAQAIVTPTVYFGPWRVGLAGENATIEPYGSQWINGSVSQETNARNNEGAYLRFEAPAGLSVVGPEFVSFGADSVGRGEAAFSIEVKVLTGKGGQFPIVAHVYDRDPRNSTVAPVGESVPFVVLVPDRGIGFQMVALGVVGGALGAAAVALYWRRLRD